MADAVPGCLYVIDTGGLLELARSKSNSLKNLCFDYLSKGTMAVPVCVWKEFANLYEREAKALAAHVQNKISLKKKYHIGAAAIADNCNPGFPLSPHDERTDWYTASISIAEGWTVVTAGNRLAAYKKLGCTDAVSLMSLGK